MYVGEFERFNSTMKSDIGSAESLLRLKVHLIWVLLEAVSDKSNIRNALR